LTSLSKKHHGDDDEVRITQYRFWRKMTVLMPTNNPTRTIPYLCICVVSHSAYGNQILHCESHGALGCLQDGPIYYLDGPGCLYSAVGCFEGLQDVYRNGLTLFNGIDVTKYDVPTAKPIDNG
jgi:hypothetical protein